MPPTDPTQPSRRGFFQRLAYLLIGVAIGCMVLGFFQAAKQRQAKIDEEHRQQLQANPPPADNLFPPMPKPKPEVPVQAQPPK